MDIGILVGSLTSSRGTFALIFLGLVAVSETDFILLIGLGVAFLADSFAFLV